MCYDVIKSTQCSKRNIVIVNSERCGGGHRAVTEATHTALRKQTQNIRATVVLRACSQSCARTTQQPPFNKQRKTKKNKENKKSEKKGEEEKSRVVLDGGGARLADAATRHHLTQTQKKKRTNNEQNKHQRTQTIQKTSTRPGTSHGHHTLPSMRNQTPIHE